MNPPDPLVVIAPDSFKGSCSSPEAAAAIAAGVFEALGEAVRIRRIPLADGGEGTLDALTAAWGGRVLSVGTRDALGRERSGRVGVSADGRTAIVEAAEANGLPHVSDLPLRPLDADSFGVGLLVRAALDAGADEILLCVGGSATSDGGAGMLRALGVELLEGNGAPIPPGARGLARLDAVDLTAVDPAVRAARWRIVCDVENPLRGPRGAAAVFGPQKGASPEDLDVIDSGLARLAEVLGNTLGTDSSELASRPGLGAAGGLALGPVALWDAELVSGAELVAFASGLDEALAEADLVITGEGRLDAQSLGGKVLSRVLAGAGAGRSAGTGGSVVVIAGSVALSAAECREAGITAAFSLANGPASLAELQSDTQRLLAAAAAHVCALFAAGCRGSESGRLRS